MNRGDAVTLTLNIKVDNVYITENYADEIELTFNKQNELECVQKTLSNGDIVWNETEGKYQVTLSQKDTYKFRPCTNSVQIRILKDGQVISSAINTIEVGETNSQNTLVSEV